MEKKSDKQRFGAPQHREEKKVKKKGLKILSKKKSDKKEASKIKEHSGNLKVLLTKSAIPVIVLIVLILVPNIIGFATYQKVSDEAEVETVNYAAEVEVLEEELGILNTNMSTVSGINEELIDLVERSTEEYTSCVQEKSSLQVNYESVYDDYQSCLDSQASLSSVSDEVDSLEGDLEELQESYDNLAKNAANNICCKKKVDDSSINYFNTAGNEIVCSSSSGESLSC